MLSVSQCQLKKQLFTFSNIFLCHLMLSLSLLLPCCFSLSISFSLSQLLSLSSSTLYLITNAFPLSHAFFITLFAISSPCFSVPELSSTTAFAAYFLSPPPTTTHFSPSDIITLVTQRQIQVFNYLPSTFNLSFITTPLL